MAFSIYGCLFSLLSLSALSNSWEKTKGSEGTVIITCQRNKNQKRLFFSLVSPNQKWTVVKINVFVFKRKRKFSICHYLFLNGIFEKNWRHGKSVTQLRVQQSGTEKLKILDTSIFLCQRKQHDKGWNSVYLRMDLLQKEFTKVDTQGYKFKPHPFTIFEFQQNFIEKVAQLEIQLDKKGWWNTFP